MKAVKTILHQLEGLSLILSPREKYMNRKLKEKQANLEKQIFKIKVIQKNQEETK